MSTQPWLSGILVAAAATAQAYAQPAEVPLIERPGHITEATIVVDATPAQVYDLVTDYANWRSVFSDVLSVEVKGGGREDAKVRFKSRALEHTVTVQFENIAGKAIRFRGIEGPPGGRARGEYQLAAIDGGKRTQITARIYMDVVGAPGLFVRDKTIRGYRQAKLRADALDLMRRFAPPPEA